MASKCAICCADNREEIDQALVTKAGSMRLLGIKYGVPEHTVRWHKDHHLFPVLAAVAQDEVKLSITDAIGLLKTATHLLEVAMNVMAIAQKKQDWNLVLRANAQAAGRLTLLGQILMAGDGGPLPQLPAAGETLTLEDVDAAIEQLKQRLHENEGEVIDGTATPC